MFSDNVGSYYLLPQPTLNTLGVVILTIECSSATLASTRICMCFQYIVSTSDWNGFAYPRLMYYRQSQYIKVRYMYHFQVNVLWYYSGIWTWLGVASREFWVRHGFHVNFGNERLVTLSCIFNIFVSDAHNKWRQ